MKRLILAVALTAISTAASAQNYGYGSNSRSYGTGSNSSSHTTSGYTTNSGTYVAPYQATNPNSTQSDNYGSRGNVNPYSGATGTRNPRH